MEEKELKQWDEIRNKGFLKFVFKHGFIGFGLFFLLIVIVVDLFVTFILDIYRIKPSVYIWIYLAVSLTYGIFSWFVTEIRYKKIDG